MAIVKNKDTVSKFVRINFINSVSKLPDFDLAEERYLVPVIGFDLYDKVVALAAAAVPPEPTAGEKRDLELLEKCQAVVTPMAYLLELPTINTQLTDAGLRTIDSQNTQPAFRWAYNEVKDHLADKGAFALENLLRFLFKEKGHYPEWTGSEQFQEADSLIFKTGEEFNRYYRLHQPQRIFWELRPLIAEIEDFYIDATMGKAFFDALKTKAEPTAEEKEALELVKKAVAQLTIARAVEKLSVKITEKGFTLLMGAGSADSTNSGDKEAPAYGLSLLLESTQKSGDSYLLQLQEYLNQKASATVFTEYYSSDYYTAPATAAAAGSRNEGRKSFGLF